MATVLSLLALFVALGGTSYAAAKITGATVKDNSLTGKDIRDRSIKAADLGSGFASTGPAGPRGPQGEAGHSEVRLRASEIAPVPKTETSIVQLPLPAGKWVVTAEGLADNTGADIPSSVHCRVLGEGRALTEVLRIGIGHSRSGTPFAFTGTYHRTVAVVTSGPETLSLSCSATTDHVVMRAPNLSAIRAGELSVGPGA